MTFGLGPANAAGKVDGRPFFNYSATGGAQITDHVAVINLSNQPQTFSLYVTDASNSDDGGFTYPLPTVKPVDAGGWMHVETPGGDDQVVVPPRQTVSFPVRISIPQSAGPGDHAAAVIVSLKAAGTRGGQQVTLDQRVAAKAFFRVSGVVHAKLEVQRLTASYEATGIFSGTVTTTYKVHNAGNVKLAGRQLVRISGLFTSRQEHPADVPLLLPNGNLLVTTVTKGVHPFVWMTSKVSVTPLGIRGDAAAPASVATAQVHFWAVPWLLLLIVLAVLLVAYAWRQLRRRRAAGPDVGPQSSEPPAPPAPTPAAALLPTAPVSAAEPVVPVMSEPVVAPEPAVEITPEPVAAPRPAVVAPLDGHLDPIPEDWATPYSSDFLPQPAADPDPLLSTLAESLGKADVAETQDR